MYQKLCKVIPGGVNSPARSYRGMGVDPLVIERGEVDCIYTVDGREFIDYVGSWGPLIHGHAHPMIIEAVKKRIEKGTTFGTSTSIEAMIAKKVTELIPSIEMVRFVSSGTEATMSAVRVARGFTGQNKIIKFIGNYHGHADLFLVQAGSGVSSLPQSSSAGIPQEAVAQTICLPYNDIEACCEILRREKIAAVILEPIAGNMGVVPATKQFLEAIREVTLETGTLLIFDEVMSGFRVAKGGAQELYGLTPDLTCLGKIIGGGFPAAAFGGSAEIMEVLSPLGPVYQAGTLSGNPVAMEAGYQSLCLLDEEGFYASLEQKTRRLTDPIEAYLAKQSLPVCLQRVGSMLTLFFGATKVSNMADAQKCNGDLFAAFFRHLLSEGIHIPCSQMEAWFVSSAHTDEHLDRTAEVIIHFLEGLNAKTPKI